MKRWTTILGRGGTVLVSISLALFLVSLIPPITIGTSKGGMPISPGQVYPTSYRALTPQQGFWINVTVDGTIDVYLLELGAEASIPGASMIFADAAELQKFLDTNPDLIIWEYELTNGFSSRYFTPTRVMNATLVLYNPTSDQATVDYEITLTSTVAPGEKVRTISYMAAPVGLLLTSPWLLDMWKQRKQK